MPEGERNSSGLLSDRHIVKAFAVGIGFVLLGFACETWLPAIGNAISNAWHLLSDPQATAAAVAPANHIEGGSHELSLVALLALLLKEVGVAFMVAAIIGFALEKQAKERDNERAMQLRADVANDAVFAIYGVRHRREFVRAVVETNLEQRIVREEMDLNYSLRALTRDEANTIYPSRPEEALQRFVILEMKSTYSFRNVSSSGLPVRVRYVVPTRQGKGARALSRAHYVRIGDETLDEAQVEAAIQPGGVDDLEYAWTRTLQPNAPLPVIVAVRCVKELSDNEVWGSFYPTVDGVTLTLSVLEGMRFGVRPLSSATLSEQPTVPSSTSRTWRLSGPLLTHNSAVFWWRTPEDDGEEASSAPVAFSPPDAANGTIGTEKPGGSRFGRIKQIRVRVAEALGLGTGT